jgi:hypothetical protein
MPSSAVKSSNTKHDRATQPNHRFRRQGRSRIAHRQIPLGRRHGRSASRTSRWGGRRALRGRCGGRRCGSRRCGGRWRVRRVTGRRRWPGCRRRRGRRHMPASAVRGACLDLSPLEACAHAVVRVRAQGLLEVPIESPLRVVPRRIGQEVDPARLDRRALHAAARRVAHPVQLVKQLHICTRA